MTHLLAGVDARVFLLVGVALVAGFVRGFSGFGGGMIFIPVASLAYNPQLAVVWLFVADNIASLPLLPPAFRKWDWRAVLPLAAGAAVGSPLGVELLRNVDANLLRWVMCCSILLTVGLLAAGVRYTGRLPWPGSAGVGGLSGIMTGALGMGGPPVVLLWLGGQDDAAQTRANIITCFALTTIVATASFVLAGLMTWPRILAGMGLAVAYGLALLVGIRVFSRSTERHYRRAALAICATAAVIGLPLWQRA